ncbi:MAG TPA: hypothetical protein VL979_04740 [Solirubrobacteraceae bacterium]|nr:hypothetical protein [Solirubrobacteraceae bacterium]
MSASRPSVRAGQRPSREVSPTSQSSAGEASLASRASAGEASLEPYAALGRHAELELELAGRGEIAPLAELGERWRELTAALPAHPPPDAAPLIERARLINVRARVELVRLRELLLGELATTRQARRTARGYSGQLAPRPRVDRSA